MKEADKEARVDLERHWQAIRNENAQKMDYEPEDTHNLMDVDP